MSEENSSQQLETPVQGGAPLRGVTCFFSLKRPGQRGDLVDALTELGGKATLNLSEATHLVYSDGNPAFYQEALQLKLRIVKKAWRLMNELIDWQPMALHRLWARDVAQL